MALDNNNLYYDSSEAENLAKYTLPPDEFVATPSDVRDEHIILDAVTREELVGTMPEHFNIDIEIKPGEEYNIPEGYHDGKGKVYSKDLAEYTYGTATEEDIAFNKVAWVNGERLVGTLDKDENDQVGTATSEDIAEGKTAWVNRKEVVGSIPVLPRKDVSLLAGETYQLPYGIESGTSVIGAVDLASQTPGDIEPEDVAINKTAWSNGNKIIGTFDKDNYVQTIMADTDAIQPDVREGKKFYSSALGIIGTGTMKDHLNEPARTLRNGESYTIPEGYHDGRGILSAIALKDVTVASADASSILHGKTAWVNGELILGEMYQNVTDASDTTASEFDILSGKTAYIEGHKVKGRCPYNIVDWISQDNNLNDDTPIAIALPIERWSYISYLRLDIYDDDGISIISVYERQKYNAGETLTFDSGNIIITSRYGDNEIHIKDNIEGRKIAITCVGYAIIGREVTPSEDEHIMSILKTGSEINSILREIAGSKYDIVRFVHDESIPSDIETHSISIDGYEPVLVWAENNTENEEKYDIHWSSSADIIYMNEDASKTFNSLENIQYIDISGWLCDNTVNLYAFFAFCRNLTTIIGIDDWDTSKVTNMKQFVFADNNISGIDLSNWDVSNVETFNSFYGGATTKIDWSFLSKWKVSNKCTDIYAAFSGPWIDITVYSNWDLSNIENIGSMFYGYQGEVIDLDIYNFGSKVKNISNLFSQCPNLKEVKGTSLLQSRISSAEYLFNNCDSIENIDTKFFIWDESIPIDDIGDRALVYYCDNVKSLDFSKSCIHHTYELTQNCPNLESVDLSNCTIKCNTFSADHIFPDSTKLNKLKLVNATLYASSIDNLISMKSDFETSYVDITGIILLPNPRIDYMDMGSTFVGVKECIGYEDIDTSKMNYITGIFTKAQFDVDISRWNLEKATILDWMFDQYYGKNITLGKLNTSKVTSMHLMFRSAPGYGIKYEDGQEILDVSGLDVSEVTTMESMFAWDTRSNPAMKSSFITTIDTTGWNTSKVTDMSNMFNERYNLKEIIGINNWDVSKVTDMSNFINGAFEVLDISNWHLDSLTNASNMISSRAETCRIICSEETENKIKSLFTPADNIIFERPSTESTE